MARKKAGDQEGEDSGEGIERVQADRGSVAIGEVNIGGDLSGSFTVGYTAEQVSLLLTQISSSYQPKPFDGRCPYKGLEVFQEQDADLFFGRERLVEDLVSRVKESRTVFITGPSGSGKSSLVRAGLIHTLKQGVLKSHYSERWLYETITPGREPLKELALAFSRLKGPDLADYFRAHANESDILNKCAESVLSGNRDQRLVLCVDQFEEVFTQIGQPERMAFLKMLAHAESAENGRMIMLFAMRSDFVSSCATYPQVNALLNKQFVQIGAMQPEELVSAIALPARQVGLRIDPDLIAQIINDMKGEPGALPLMQFALKDLFDSQPEQNGIIALTLEDYLRHGGIQKSLERHADKSFTQLRESEQQLARSIFSGLIEIGRGTQDTRRTALLDELVPANAKTAAVVEIIQKLADARLIITDEKDKRDTVTLAHEKLIDAWPWLKKLVNENRDAIALQNEIASDAKEWDDHKRDSSYLYRGAKLAYAWEQFGEKKFTLGSLAHQFLTTGRTLERRSRMLTISTIVLLGIVSTFFGYLSAVNLGAARQANNALAYQLGKQAQTIYRQDPTQPVAVLLAIRAIQLFPIPEAQQILQKIVQRRDLLHEAPVTSVAIRSSGDYALSGSYDGTARVWDLATGREIWRLTHNDIVTSAVFSPGGKYVVSGSYDNTARVWDISTGREVARVTLKGPVKSVAFSSDTKYVVSGSEDHTVHVWEAMTGQEIARMTHDDIVTSVAFSPDDNFVASGSQDHTLRVWEAHTGKEIARMHHDDIVNSLAFRPDGKYVVSGSDDHTVRLWEVSTGKEIARMSHDDIVAAVVFSADGKYVASASWDNTARIWEASTGKEIARIVHTDIVTSVAFSSDGKYLASGSNDGTTRLFELSSGKVVDSILHDAAVNSVAISANNQYVLSGTLDFRVGVWTRGAEPQELITLACGQLNRNLTRAEWSQYMGPDLPYNAVCPGKPIEPQPTFIASPTP